MLICLNRLIKKKKKWFAWTGQAGDSRPSVWHSEETIGTSSWNCSHRRLKVHSTWGWLSWHGIVFVTMNHNYAELSVAKVYAIIKPYLFCSTWWVDSKICISSLHLFMMHFGGAFFLMSNDRHCMPLIHKISWKPPLVSFKRKFVKSRTGSEILVCLRY